MRPPTLVKSSALNFADGATSLVAALIVSVLLARTLGPERFGQYALVMAIVSFAYVLAQLGVPATVRRYAAELDGHGQLEIAGLVAGRALRIGLRNALAVTLFLSLSAIPVAAFFDQPLLRVYLVLGAARLIPMIAVGVLRSLLGGLQQYAYLVHLNLVMSPMWVAGCAVALWFGAGIVGVLVTSFVVEGLLVVGLAWRAQRQVGIRWRGRLPDSLHSRIVRYNWALAAIVLLNVIVWQRSELLFLGRFSGAVQVSYYAVPFALTSRGGDLLPGAILGVLLPNLTHAQGAGDHTRFNAVFGEAVRYLAMLTLPICLFGIPLAPTIIRVVYGPAFGPAAVVLQILLVSIIFSVLGQASQSALLGVESQGWLVKTGIAAAVLSIGLDLALIPRWGAIGAAVANTIVQGIWALAIFAPLWKRLFAVSRRAIAKTAAVAGALAAVLTLFVVLGPATLTVTMAGVIMLVAYGLALHRLNLIRPMPEGV
jgi:O-antigen/teichoic acid export membrane protein